MKKHPRLALTVAAFAVAPLLAFAVLWTYLLLSLAALAVLRWLGLL